MINSLHIKGFRGFKDFKVEGLGRVNLIIGKNNAGKTSLLEAVYLLTARGGDPFVEISRGEDLLTSQLNLFNGRPASDSKGEITIESDQGAKIELRLGAYRINLAGGGLQRSFGLGESLMTLAASAPVFIRSGIYHELWVAQAWDRIVLTPSEDEVVRCLRVMVPDLERVAMIGKMPIVQLQGHQARVTMASLGDGVTRLFHLACGLVMSSSDVCLVEEIGNGIHHSVHAKMWQFVFEIAKKQNVQVFATSHGLDCLRGFADATSDSPDITARVIRLDDRKGKVVPVMFDEDEARIAAREEIEIR
jgi:ABC-type branched-subunit amino acid transport system ATPase component